MLSELCGNKEVFDVAALNRLPYFEDHSGETFKMIIDTAMKISTEMMFPYFKEMDVKVPYWEDGRAHVAVTETNDRSPNCVLMIKLPLKSPKNISKTN